MKLQDLYISRFGFLTGLMLSKLPLWAGYPLAAQLSKLVARRKNAVDVLAVRANQWVVHYQALNGKELDQMVLRTYRNTSRSLYEFWHNVGDHTAMRSMVDIQPSFYKAIATARENKNGLIFTAPHMTNFDMIGQAVALDGTALHILSYPQPPGGYQSQNKIRELPNLKVTPLSVHGLQMGSETIRENGIVVTGIDRPLVTESRKYAVNFFNRPTYLPVFHIRLALKHNTPIAVIGGCRSDDGRYSVWASDLYFVERRKDLVEEIVINADPLLRYVEDNIKQAPDQWAMFYPVWPEAINLMPG